MAQGVRWAWIGAAVLLALALARSVRPSTPSFVMEALCFALFACAFNLLIGYVGLLVLRSRGVFRQRRVRHRPRRQGVGLAARARILAGVAVAAILGTVFGWLAIRRQGIYFAMITLALAQMVYFVALQVPFTHGEDGIQAVPRGRLFGVIDLDDTLAMYYFVLAVFLLGFALDPQNDQLAFRPGDQGDPRKRAARPFARLSRRSLQARRLHPLGGPVRSRRVGEVARLPARHADRRRVDDVGLGRADDLGRRAGNGARPGGRGIFSGGDAALPGPARLLGHSRSGHHLRLLRAGLPPRHRRRHRVLCRVSPRSGYAQRRRPRSPRAAAREAS